MIFVKMEVSLKHTCILLALLSVALAKFCREDSEAFEIPKEAKTEKIKENHNITLECLILFPSNPKPCLWYIDPPIDDKHAIYPDEFSEKYEFAKENTNKNCSITIYKFAKEDERQWSCAYMHNQKNVEVCSKPITLQLDSGGKDAFCKEDPSTFNEPENKMTEIVKKGVKVKLKCPKFDRRSSDTCRWHVNPSIKAKSVINIEDFSGKYEISKDCSLTIFNVTTEDIKRDWKCSYVPRPSDNITCSQSIKLVLATEEIEEDDSGVNTGLIIGCVITAMVIVAVILAFVIIRHRKKLDSRQTDLKSYKDSSTIEESEVLEKL